jgi:hypothetical protein
MSIRCAAAVLRREYWLPNMLSSNTRPERRKLWSFYQLSDGKWVWRVVYADLTDATADVSFGTFEECKRDAEKRGYIAVTAANERRRAADTG